MRSLTSFGILLSAAISVHAQQSGVVISQIYGGGGNAGAPLRSDFIELFNRGSVAADLAGWTVQYASSTGSSWSRTELQGIIQPGQYFLVVEHTGDTGAALPIGDAAGGINLSATTGKVALVRNNTLLVGTTPATIAIADLVGYGTANFAEGDPAPSLSNTTAALRRGRGCTDTNRNSSDFATGVPEPRNRVTAAFPCAAIPSNPIISQGGVANAASYSAQAVAPGEIVTIFGDHLGPPEIRSLQLTDDGTAVTTSLGGTRVLVGGVPAPLIYTLNNQVSAIIPQSASLASSVEIRVEFNGRTSDAVRLPVAPAVPGIFTLDSSGLGQGAILNQDYSVNGSQRAARPGDVVIVYGTGGGVAVPAAPDGAVVGVPLPLLQEAVSVRIGGLAAEVLYSGMAPSLVNGVFQINARVPLGLPAGGALPLEVSIGGAVSQSGVTVFIEGPPIAGDGVGPLIEQRLRELRANAVPPPLPGIPHDRIGILPDLLGLVSWNIQVGGTSTAEGALRPPMVADALRNIFGGTYQLLVAQEIPNRNSAELLTSLLPGGTLHWKSSFIDSTDSMDNGFWLRNEIVLRDAFLLHTMGTSSTGLPVTSPDVAVHPPQVAQFVIGDFDFTLVNVHLTFAGGDTAESAREMRAVLDYLDWYFDQSNHDPDVIICGDFNIPSLLSGQRGRGGLTLDEVLQADPRFQVGERRFVVLVHQPTSRSSQANGGVPANNYDHCVLSADALEEFVTARRIDPSILTDHPEDPEIRLTSDHFPIAAFFQTHGEFVSLDRRFALRPDHGWDLSARLISSQ